MPTNNIELLFISCVPFIMHLNACSRINKFLAHLLDFDKHKLLYPTKTYYVICGLLSKAVLQSLRSLQWLRHTQPYITLLAGINY